uniref:Trichome birefringence-like C-terminal domain-containing protein n=1 Tax=Oryza brachyantha TaxID=4533 RepID=J3LU52_ORYBR
MAFNATAVLEMLRGKRMLFVGDSLLREQYVSLLCLLHRAIPDASKSFEAVDSLSIFRAKDHDATIEFYWAPMLAESSSDDGADHHLADRVIRGAPMNKHSRFWKGADVLVFNSYLWWMTGDKIQILRGADEDMSKDIVEMEAEEAYRLVLHQVVRWVEHNVDPKNARVFFVTASPTHASGGEAGGNCYGQTSPVAAADAESYHGSTSGRMLQVAGEVLAASRVPVGVVNITRMSELRRDAHTQTYKEQWAQPAAEQAADPRSYADCTHWCLPGVPDAWNELLYWKLFFPARDQAI